MSRKTRKLMWLAPVMAVLAIAGALAIFVAQTPNPALAHDPPGTVTGVEAEADGATKIKISWTAPASGTGGAPTGYRIDVSDDTLVWKTLVADTGSTDTSYTHMDLKPETGKYYLVIALNSAGAGPSSIDPLYAYAMTGEASVPSAVLNLRAKAVGSSKIELSWTPPAQDGHADIDFYCIVADDVEEGTETEPLAWPTSYDNVVDPAADPVVANTEVRDACTATAQAQDGGIADNTNGGTSPAFAEGFLIVVDGKKTTYDLKGTTLLSESQHWRFRAYAKNSAGISSAVSNTARARLADTPDTGKPTDVRIALSSSQTAGDGTADDLTDDTWTYATNFQVYFNWPVVDGKAATVGGFQYQSRVTAADGTWPAWDSTVTGTNTSAVAITDTAPAGPEQATVAVPGTFDGEGDRFQVRLRVVRTHDADPTADTTGPGSWVESNIIVHQGTGTERGEGTANRVPLRVPGPVTGLDADDDKSLNRINLKWDRGSDATYSSIDVSDGGIVWIRLERNTKWARETYNHRNVKPGSDFTYRVTPGHNRWGLGLAVTNDGSTQPAVEPDPVRGLTVTANGQDMLDLNWPLISEANDGGSPIVGYLVQVNDDDDNNTTLDSDGSWGSVNTTTVSGATVTDGASGGSYTYADDDTPLTAGSVRWFRVFAVNSENATTAPTADDRASAEPKMGKTAAPAKPGAPVGLVAETARDANSAQRTELGVDLLWNQGYLAAGDTIKGYVVDRMVNGGEWESILPTGDSNTGDNYTRFTDTAEPTAGEVRAYRVAAVASDGQGPWSNTAYYPQMHLPGMPASLTAEKDMDMPGTKVNLTWTAPDMNAHNVDGYIIERRYDGDMTMAIPSDGYNAEFNGARHAFMDYKEWWETLNCKGMLAVANIVEADATDEQKAMYCKHFADTAPTNMAFEGKVISEETAMKVKELFMKRYVTDDMGKTMTMFEGMMYTDMGLMENTEYTYRVRAIHGMEVGMWSDPATVMTTMDNSDPTEGDAIPDQTLTVGEKKVIDLSMHFSDADVDADELTYTPTSSDSMIASAGVGSDEPFDHLDTYQLEITAVAVGGPVTITVTASDGMGGTDAMQTFMVTVESDEALRVSSSDADDGTITIMWKPIEGATSYHAIAYDRGTGEFDIKVGLEGTTRETTFTGLTSGSSYAIGLIGEMADGSEELVLLTPPFTLQ